MNYKIQVENDRRLALALENSLEIEKKKKTKGNKSKGCRGESETFQTGGKKKNKKRL